MKDLYIFLSEKKWHKELFENLEKKFQEDSWIWICSKDDFTFENIRKINPKKIFIPHWSYIIPKEIYDNFECIVFHMTDLPYGRGGSPLQNLIVRGHENTKISALRVVKEVDAGDIYLKESLDLSGSAREIFNRTNKVIYSLISRIILEQPNPTPQKGEIVHFKRRTPEMSDIQDLESLQEVYNYIRMLDADGYPHAYIETKYLKFEFTDCKIDKEEIIANVRIIKK